MLAFMDGKLLVLKASEAELQSSKVILVGSEA
jgi:hypothetical protein